MKHTPFYNEHLALGAKMVDFAGYMMPVSYKGIIEEHNAVRNRVGIFDVSHMGEFILKGDNALSLIQKLCSNDASKLTDGKAQYSCFTNLDGGIIDDLIIYCLEQNKAYMLVVNASNIDKDWKWLQDNNDQNVEMSNISDKTALLAVQGPKAIATIQKLTDIDVSNLKYYTFAKCTLAGVPNVIVSATGYTGSGGVEIYFENKGDDAQKIWNAILEAGNEFQIEPCGLGARDTLRLEMGYCLYGNDIDDTTSPLEAGLGWITKFTKEFTADDILEKQKSEGIRRKLVGFIMEDRGIPRHGYTLCNADGEAIGHVTSGTQSPSINQAIGMGYVLKPYSNLDTEIYVQVRDKKLKAKIHNFPFYNHP